MAPDSGWRRDLYVIIFEADTKYGRMFDLVLLWSILISVLLVILESDANFSRAYITELKYAEWFFTILFSVEYLLRTICVTRPTKYMTSFFGVVDLISVAPTYLSLFTGGTHLLLVLRAIRLLRVFRILKLVRYLRASEVLLTALKASRAKITVFLGVVLTIVLIMGTVMHVVESGNPGFSSIPKGMYWAIVTMTTVGYGDTVPLTTLGKFLASFIMIVGYGIIAVPTGIVSVELSNATNQKEKVACCAECGARYPTKNSLFCHLCGEPRAMDPDADVLS